MTEMRRAAWSGLDGRVVLRCDRRLRAVEPSGRLGTVRMEAVAEPATPAVVAIDPPGD